MIINHEGVVMEQFKHIPHFLYGTAWKEERTEGAVMEALQAGFPGIDTANQRKHYFEEAVGIGISNFLKTSGKKRDDLFLQTKYTYQRGQDHRLPYDPDAKFSVQVQQSFEKSLQHLQTDYLDSFVLHGPYGYGIQDEDFEVWTAMEKIQKEGKAKFLGVSNVDSDQLISLYQFAKIKPKFVQNRCYARTGWDKDVRKFCKENQIIYQGFSLLTANMRELMTSTIHAIAEKFDKTVPQIIFKFAIQTGMLPLTGTTNPTHMKEDLKIHDFELNSDEMQTIETISQS